MRNKNYNFSLLQDKHNLYDENMKPITPGVFEVTREEFFKVIRIRFWTLNQIEW